MANRSIEAKRRMEKEVFTIGIAFVNPPPKTTPEGNRQYMATRRKLEKCVADPSFQTEFVNQYRGFVDFLNRYNVNAADLQGFLNADLKELVKKRR